jgi:peptidoglycan/xylan/chitin deacetylase (PgdA/CDA1 family)
MARNKPIASVSLDLDNKWSYLKTHGNPIWQQFPSYLDVVVPRVLEFLRARDLKITFFIVGQDAALPESQPLLRSLAEAGHEIGNHSFHHEPWLHLYSEAQIDEELARAEEHIAAATGQRTVGFRGPGYSLALSTLRVLKQRGYAYDCSTFPTYLGPLARAYYFMTAKLSAEERQKRKKLFGTWTDGLRPNKPYRWQIDGAPLLEIPVTTMPLFKIPIHASYLLYLAMYSRPLAFFYFRVVLLLCALTGVRPSFLLHPLDFLGNDDVRDLEFFPAMKTPGVKKMALVGEFLDMLAKRYQLGTMKAHADDLAARRLPARRPDFPPQTEALPVPTAQPEVQP